VLKNVLVCLITLVAFSQSDDLSIYSYNTGDGDTEFIFDSLSPKNEKTQVFHESGVYYVYFYNSIKQKTKKGKKYSKRFGNIHIERLHDGHLFKSNSYKRYVVPKKYIESDFVVTPENLKKSRLEEIKNSQMDDKDLKALEESIEQTSFRQATKQLSYLVNIIKDHKNKGKVINK
jgi:hypothetical protein